MQGISAKCKFFGLPYSMFLLTVYKDWMLPTFSDSCMIFVLQCLTFHGTEELHLETGVALFYLMQTIEQGKSSDNCNAGFCLRPTPLSMCVFGNSAMVKPSHSGLAAAISPPFLPFSTEWAPSKAAPSAIGNASIPYLSTHSHSCFYWIHHRNTWELLIMEDRLRLLDR